MTWSTLLQQAQLLYEEISPCQGTKKAQSCQVEADYFTLDSTGECVTTRNHEVCVPAKVQRRLC